eukprot:2656927-Pleurochrysis_carterae.AAC.1
MSSLSTARPAQHMEARFSVECEPRCRRCQRAEGRSVRAERKMIRGSWLRGSQRPSTEDVSRMRRCAGACALAHVQMLACACLCESKKGRWHVRAGTYLHM